MKHIREFSAAGLTFLELVEFFFEGVESPTTCSPVPMSQYSKLGGGINLCCFCVCCEGIINNILSCLVGSEGMFGNKCGKI